MEGYRFKNVVTVQRYNCITKEKGRASRIGGESTRPVTGTDRRWRETGRYDCKQVANEGGFASLPYHVAARLNFRLR